MLYLTRKVSQSILIGENIEVTVVHIQGKQVRLGIVAPEEVNIARNEIHDPQRGTEFMVKRNEDNDANV